MSLNDAYDKSRQGQKKLFQAVLKGKLQQLQDVLTNGFVDVNSVDFDSRTPLLHAVVLERSDIKVLVLRCLLDAGADVNAKDADGKTALMYAVSDQDSEDSVKLLLGVQRCNPNAQDHEGNTALIHAVNCNNVKAIRSLVGLNSQNRTADIKLTNKHGHSALLLAVKLRRTECCQVLVLEAGADPNDVSKHWQSTLVRMLTGSLETPVQPTVPDYRHRRSSIFSLPATSKSSMNTTCLRVGQRPKDPKANPRRPLSRPSSPVTSRYLFNSKVPLRDIQPAEHESKNNAHRKRMSPHITDGTRTRNPSHENEHSFSYRTTTSRENTSSTLLSKSIFRHYRGRPLAMREESYSSTDTFTTLQSRPNTRQDSDLSKQSLEGDVFGRSPFLKHEISDLSKPGRQWNIAEAKVALRRSYSRPSTSLFCQSSPPWSNTTLCDGWLQTIPTRNTDIVRRTFTSLSSYKQGLQCSEDKSHKTRMSTVRKEAALKQIRGNLRLSLTPTLSMPRLFASDTKPGRKLPPITIAKD